MTLILIILLNLNHFFYSDYFIIEPLKGVDSIKLDKRLKISTINKFGEYKMRNLEVNGCYKSKTRIKIYEFQNGIIVRTRKNGIYKLYKVSSIFVSFPFKAKTDKGIILGESTKQDILKTYGEPDEVFSVYLFYKRLNLTFVIENDSSKYYVKEGKRVNLYNKVKEIRIYK